jgi:enoyl-[acyl-carrier protein] reductase II
VKKKNICSLFGIQYPILQGGMLWVATAELAASVSNAGALGILSPYAGMEEDGDAVENLRLQMRQTRSLTDKPFGVNIPLDLPTSGLLVDVLLRENGKIAVTAAGSPALFTELLHSAGIEVVHLVSSVRQAQLAESCRVDAVIAEGAEAAGRLGHDELSLFSLIPQIADAVSLPVIAAGGIVDGRGMAAAFALGADGVQLGTRFVAAEECIAHRDYKQAVVAARDTGTIITRRALVPTRSLKSDFSLELAALEGRGAPAERPEGYAGGSRTRKAQIDGDLSEGDAYAGSSAGLIREILPAAAIVENLVRSYDKALRRMHRSPIFWNPI